MAAVQAFSVYRETLLQVKVKRNIKLTGYEERVAMANFLPRPLNMLGIKLMVNHPNKNEIFSLKSLLWHSCETWSGSLVGQTGRLEATDPRDKIFGLLGIASDCQELGILGVKPDYTLSCRDVYTIATAALLKRGEMSILSWCQLPQSLKDLPSWVPDYSQPFNSPLQAYISTVDSTVKLHPEYKAGKSERRASIVFKTNDVITGLGLSGTIWDSIHAFGISYDEISKQPLVKFNSWGRPWILELDRLSRLRESCFSSEQSRQDAIIWTTTADFTRHQDGSWGRMNSHRAVAATLVTFGGLDQNLIMASGLGLLLQRNGLPPLITDEAIQRWDVLSYLGDIGIRARRRKPFITTKGNLGLGPLAMQEGDMVAVLAGANVPFIVRKATEGRLEIVGEAYVNGIMDGEAFEKPGSSQILEFC